MVLPDVAEARAEDLLTTHLTPAQRAEYAATGRITIVKRGFVWRVLVRDLAKVLPLLLLFAIPGWRMAALVLAMTLVITLTPLWLPRFSLASTRKRVWSVSARTSPIVKARGRTTRFCVSFRENLPAGDRVLAWKHLIEVSEAHFLRTANIRA